MLDKTLNAVLFAETITRANTVSLPNKISIKYVVLPFGSVDLIKYWIVPGCLYTGNFLQLAVRSMLKAERTASSAFVTI